MARGAWFAVGAYLIWGLFPVYWKALEHIPALELIGHRILWSCLILLVIILVTRQWRAFVTAIRSPSALGIYSIAAILIGVNWLTYVWAVNAGFIVETSLGYFINPLLSVLLGVLFFRERLRIWQWVPIGLATLGVLYLTLSYGALPWIALTLAFTFALYGLVKKAAPLGSVHGLALETGILLLPAIIYLLILENTGQGAFAHSGSVTDLLLIGAGIVTTVPLLMFASAARSIPLSLVGLLQYIAPTLQFLLGVLVYGEPFTMSQFVGFAAVWLALAIFAVEGMHAGRAASVPVIAD